MPSTAFRAVRASNMQPEALWQRCGSYFSRFQGVFADNWSARARTLRKHAKLGCSYFNDCGRNRSPSPSAYKPNSHAPWPVTLSSPEWSQQASSVCSSPSTQG